MRKTRQHLQKPYPADSIQFAWAALADQAALHGALELIEFDQKTGT
jgi:hypothetical protein